VIRVVGANPALDRVSTWPAIALGTVNRAREVTVLPGGKGLNVARAIRALGSEVSAYGFLGGEVGALVRELARAEGVVDRHTPIAAGTRVCFILVEPDRGRSTVLNEPGPQVTPAERADLLRGFRGDCRPGDVVLLSGSLPDSLPPALAGEVVAIARAGGARTIVDMSGASLVAAFAERPWMIKCNRDELAALTGADGDAEALEAHHRLGLPELASEMRKVLDHGPAVLVVTLGPDGVLVADSEGVSHVVVPEVRVVNETGSGDLLLAGLAVGIERGSPVLDAVALGAACGTAGATVLLPSLPEGFDPEAWLTRVRVERLETAR
jgi:1-phosphofructokinase family hexose kinase